MKVKSTWLCSMSSKSGASFFQLAWSALKSPTNIEWPHHHRSTGLRLGESSLSSEPVGGRARS